MALPRPAPAAGPAADVPGSATSPPRAATGRGCSSPSPARLRPRPTPEPGPTPRRPRPGAASPPPTSQPPLAPTSRPRPPRPPTGKSATSSTCWTGPRTGRTAAPPTPRRSPPSAASRPPPTSRPSVAAGTAATEGLDVGGGLLAAEGGDRRGVGGAAVRPVRGPVQQVDDVADLPVGGRGGRGRLVGARGGWLVGGGLAAPGRGRRGVGPGSGVGRGRSRAGLGDEHPRPVAALGGEVAEQVEHRCGAVQTAGAEPVEAGHGGRVQLRQPGRDAAGGDVGGGVGVRPAGGLDRTAAMLDL